MNLDLFTAFILFLGTIITFSYLFYSLKNTNFFLLACALGSIWVGYLLSPILSLIDSQYSSWMLVKSNISDVIQFAFSCMIAIWLGYILYLKKNKETPHEPQIMTVSNDFFERWYFWIALVLSLLSFTLFIITIGGFHNLWESEFSRGHLQFATKTNEIRIIRTLNVIGGLIRVFCTLFGAVLLIYKGYKLKYLSVSLILLLSGSLPYFHALSRASGMAFVFIALIGLIKNSYRFLTKAIICLFIAFFLAQVGLSARANYKPGVGNFLLGTLDQLSTISPLNSNDQSYHQTYLYEINPLDQVPPATQVFEAKKEANVSITNSVLAFFCQINPFPAEFIPLKTFGINSLSERMGTVGSTGITVPALGQIYYALDYFGLFIWFLVGIFLSWIQISHNRMHTILTTIAIMFALAGLIAGLHQQTRAMVRPFQISLITILLQKYSWWFEWKR